MKDYVYMICVDGDDNHNKFYEAILNDDYSIHVNYGRVGGKSNPHDYEAGEKNWAMLIHSKEMKGYNIVKRGLTETRIVDKNISDADYNTIKEEDIRAFVKYTIESCEQFMKETYTVKPNEITPNMISNAEVLMARLEKIEQEYLDATDRSQKSWKLREFNQILQDLYTSIPRKMEKVADHLLNTGGSYSKTWMDNFLDAEKDRLETARLASVASRQTANVTVQGISGSKNILKDNGLDIRHITYAEEDKVLELLYPRNFNKLNNVDTCMNILAVINPKTTDSYNTYKANNGIKAERLLWHGTDINNVWSIIKNGMIISSKRSPKGGRAFGNGLYFADKSEKSKNYTTVKGAYRNTNKEKDNRHSGWLLLYDVATGNEYRTHDTYIDGSGLMKTKGYNSLQYMAGGGGDFQDNETVVYDANACNIRYVVEVKESAHPLIYSLPYSTRKALTFEGAIDIDRTGDSINFVVDTNRLDPQTRHILFGETNLPVTIAYDKQTDRINGKFKALLSPCDMKWIMRQMKKEFAESNDAFTKFLDTPPERENEFAKSEDIIIVKKRKHRQKGMEL